VARLGSRAGTDCRTVDPSGHAVPAMEHSATDPGLVPKPLITDLPLRMFRVRVAESEFDRPTTLQARSKRLDSSRGTPGVRRSEARPHLTRQDSRRHYEAGTEFAIEAVWLVGDTGTHLASPSHRYPGGMDQSSTVIVAAVRYSFSGWRRDREAPSNSRSDRVGRCVAGSPSDASTLAGVRRDLEVREYLPGDLAAELLPGLVVQAGVLARPDSA
jgi:hypothetical protein